MNPAPRVPVPLRRRLYDLVFLVFFLVNLTFITYVVDLEQLIIADPRDFEPPLWPPPALVDLVHWYGTTYDPLLMARPPFWRMTIWIDVLFFGPFYAFAIVAFVRGRDWIRTPALVWSGTMLANVLIILMEERYGQWATPRFADVLALNTPWLLMPLATIWRMRRPYPFTEPQQFEAAHIGRHRAPVPAPDESGPPAPVDGENGAGRAEERGQWEIGRL
jgi:EXPERA (EXPanded EBP superfamily)